MTHQGKVSSLYGEIYTDVELNVIIKLHCHIQCALHDELECSLALTHIVPIYIIYIYTIK